ncbi:MAG: MurR/RpiR family transcriptional regulator [Acidimicrobiia bacterium]|nr:MurR/RpiR family transcriptional regulator [Acidimicrobiia bacterium]
MRMLPDTFACCQQPTAVFGYGTRRLPNNGGIGERPWSASLSFAMLAPLKKFRNPHACDLEPMRRKPTARNEPSLASTTALPEPPLQRPILVYLQAILPSLNPTERQIGEYVLEDPERVLSSSISDVRRGSGASVGSIVGFCRLLGVTGFANFKISLARELAQGGFSAGLKSAEDQGSLYESVFQFHAQSLRETLQLNSEATLEQASRMIELARRVEFFSIGMSYPVAYTACNKLRLIGIAATTQSDSHLQLIAATQLQKGDVAFGISCSGSTYETVQCLQTARQNKATTLSVTNCMKSPITEHSDLVLCATPSEVKYFQAPLASRITQLALLDALFVSIAQRRKNKTAAHLQRAGEKLLEHRLIKKA